MSSFFVCTNCEAQHVWAFYGAKPDEPIRCQQAGVAQSKCSRRTHRNEQPVRSAVHLCLQCSADSTYNMVLCDTCVLSRYR